MSTLPTNSIFLKWAVNRFTNFYESGKSGTYSCKCMYIPHFKIEMNEI